MCANGCFDTGCTDVIHSILYFENLLRHVLESVEEEKETTADSESVSRTRSSSLFAKHLKIDFNMFLTIIIRR